LVTFILLRLDLKLVQDIHVVPVKGKNGIYLYNMVRRDIVGIYSLESCMLQAIEQQFQYHECH